MPAHKPIIVFLTTYPPRECGIATFSQDLFKNAQKILGPNFRCKVAAVNLSHVDTYKYPREVAWEIDQNSEKEFKLLAADINKDPRVSGVIIQHEYGIYGGPEGEKLLSFMDKCSKPMLVTLHTALPNPSPKMKEVTSKIIAKSRNIVVLTRDSKQIVENVYPNSVGKVFVIPHGIHTEKFQFQRESKTKLQLKNRMVLCTFGLLSRGKGIEYAINALPDVIKKYPSVLYLIIGETHPVIRRAEGEKYRLELVQLITSLSLEKHVKFFDQYLALPELLEFLKATDIYISTSINPHQSVSGTLSYALGTGRAVISTEFTQARELVTPDIGRLVPIKNTPAMASALLELLSNQKILERMARNAFERTRPMQWKNVARKYTNLLTRTIAPPLNLRHLENMTDAVGLFQFAKLSMPHKEYGYTLDDNSRALVLCSWIIKSKVGSVSRTLLRVYLDFVQKCQLSNGMFTNYISYGDNVSTAQNDHEDLSDTQARTQWALAEVLVNSGLSIGTRDHAKKIFLLSLENALHSKHLRTQAFRIKAFGLAQKVLPKQKKMLFEYIEVCSEDLIESLKMNSLNDWIWFEKKLNYGNALLSESLLIAGTLLGNDIYLKRGIQTLNFLIGKTFTSDMYMPIGHKEWYMNKKKRSQFDQQPEDPAAMILALSCAYRVTNSEEYRNLAQKCFSWFLGNNSLNKPLYDIKTGGCCDGLHPDRVNLNQGAESLISYLMSNYIVSTLQ